MIPGATRLRLPNFLIIGAMKGGSTSLAKYLGEHPQIFVAPKKEVHYFDRHFDEPVEWYGSHFQPGPDERAVGEATPNYLYSAKVVDRLAATLPEARLIAILRDPVERAYSHFWHERSRGREQLDFETALDAEADRLRTSDIEARAHCAYVDQGRYIDQLEYLVTRYPREQLLVLFSEDLREDPEGTVLAACQFLGAESLIPENVGRRYNEHISFRSLRVRSMAQSLSAGGGVSRFMGRAIGRLNTRRVRYPPMKPELRARLIQEFDADNCRLAEWLGRELPFWSRSA